MAQEERVLHFVVGNAECQADWVRYMSLPLLGSLTAEAGSGGAEQQQQEEQ